MDAFLLCHTQKTHQDRNFILLLVTVIVLLCGDLMSRCDPDGKAGILCILSRIGNYIIFAGDPFGYLMTLRYIDSWIADADESHSNQIMIRFVTGYVLINLIAVTLSDFGGFNWLDSFPARIYQRGPLYYKGYS